MIKKWFQGVLRRLPEMGQRVTAVQSLYQPQSWADWADAAHISAVLRAAAAGEVTALFALYRDIVLTDAHIQAELQKRKLAVLGDPYHISALSTDPQDIAAADLCRESLQQVKGFRDACSHLLNAVLWPVAVVEKIYKPMGARYVLDELVPVPYHLLDYRSGRLLIRATTPDGEPVEEYYEPDPERFIIHRGHLLGADLDRFGGPMRSLVFWWMLSTMDREWWAQFLEQFGQPFIVGKFPPGNDQDRRILSEAFRVTKRLLRVVVSKSTELELHQAVTSGADAYERFLAVAQREKSKLILGQTLSAQTDSTGLGSGVANLQADVRNDIRDFDATLLSETLRDQLFTQMCRYARLSGNAPTIVWGGPRPKELQAKANLLEALYRCGFEVAEESLPEVETWIGLQLKRRSTNLLAAFASQQFGAPENMFSQPVGDTTARLAQTFRRAFASVRHIILESASADECQDRLSEFLADWPARRAAQILEEAMTGYAAAAILRTPSGVPPTR